MIWIEGKSAAWTYLSELELTPFTTHAETSEQELSAKDEDEIERKAEELRQRVLASTPKIYLPRHVTEIETFASPYNRSEEDIQFVDHRKERIGKRNAVLGEFFLTCIVITLFILGIYRGKSFLGMKEKVQNSVATQLDSGDQHAAQKSRPASALPAIAAVDSSAIRSQDSLLALQKNSSKVSVSRRRVIDSSIKSTDLKSISLKQTEKKDTQAQSAAQVVETSIKKDDLAKKELVPSVPELKTSNEPAKEEKKGFLKGIFKKKKKEDNSQPAGNNGN